jgi:hypothetical protein
MDYKNQLCNLITQHVSHVNLVEHVSLTISFEDDSKLILSLDMDNPAIVGEIAIISDNENNLSVFNSASQDWLLGRLRK